MNCSKSSLTTELALNCYLHFQILFLFLSILFIFIISKMSKKALHDEINKTLKSNLGPVFKSQPRNIKQQLRGLPFGVFKQLYQEEQPYVKLNNKALFTTIVMLNILFLVIIIGIIILLRNKCNYCMDIKPLLIENSIVFFFVGCVEYFFFKNIAAKVVPSPPSHLAKVTVDNFKHVLKNNKSYSLDDKTDQQLQKMLLLFNIASKTN
jgi:hypothetical protein